MWITIAMPSTTPRQVTSQGSSPPPCMAQLAIRDKALSALLACTVVSDVSGVESLQQVRRLPAANLTHHDMIRAILRSIVRRRFKVTTRSQHRFAVAPNRLQRDFTAQRPNQVWVERPDLPTCRFAAGSTSSSSLISTPDAWSAGH